LFADEREARGHSTRAARGVKLYLTDMVRDFRSGTLLKMQRRYSSPPMLIYR
jgi:hypothetical protein